METSELLREQMNAGETTSLSYSNEELITKEQIGTTPFTLVKEKEKGSFIALGQHRLTDYTNNEEELLNRMEEKEWGFLMSVIATVIQLINNENN